MTETDSNLSYGLVCNIISCRIFHTRESFLCINILLLKSQAVSLGLRSVRSKQEFAALDSLERITLYRMIESSCFVGNMHSGKYPKYEIIFLQYAILNIFGVTISET